MTWIQYQFDQQPRMSARLASVAEFENLRRRVRGWREKPLDKEMR